MEKNIAALLLSVASWKADITPTPGMMASDLGIDAFWRHRGGYPVSKRGNGSARVRRAAAKARNVKCNRRADRAKTR